MDIEFHYYMTYIIARRAGFNANDSYIIAYSSQYTDDNTRHLFIDQGTDNAYESYVSQTMNILEPQKELMRIYPVFHFLPGTFDEICGDKAFRTDGKLHIMNTVPDSENGKKVLLNALETSDRYRIGIATHTYADTFAHQNFVGADDSFNSMAGLLEKLIPSIGHADARHQPDIPNLLWWDGRLVPTNASVNNKDRFLDAAAHIFDLYRSIRAKGTDGKERLFEELGDAIGDSTTTKSERVKAYKALIGDEFVEYDEKDWFDEAVSFKVDTIFSRDSGDTVPKDVTVSTWRDENFKNTKWFAFQEAVKAHQEYVLSEVLRPIYRKMGQTVW